MIDLNEVERQARAEVLAACESSVVGSGLDDKAVNHILKRLRELQPAAKDLEELLRPGRELAQRLMKATRVEDMGMRRSTFRISDSDLKECCEEAHATLEKS